MRDDLELLRLLAPDRFPEPSGEVVPVVDDPSGMASIGGKT